MAAADVTISGVLYYKDAKARSAGIPVTIIGSALITRPDEGPPVQPPGDYPHPEHPIMLPGMPGWGDPHPEHPIVIPEPPVDPPVDPPGLPDFQPGGGKPPPSDGGWGWFPPYGWGYFPGEGEAGPKRRRR